MQGDRWRVQLTWRYEGCALPPMSSKPMSPVQGWAGAPWLIQAWRASQACVREVLQASPAQCTARPSTARAPQRGSAPKAQDSVCSMTVGPAANTAISVPRKTNSSDHNKQAPLTRQAGQQSADRRAPRSVVGKAGPATMTPQEGAPLTLQPTQTPHERTPLTFQPIQLRHEVVLVQVLRHVVGP